MKTARTSRSKGLSSRLVPSLGAFLLVGQLASAIAGEPATEQTVRAAMVFNFLRFTELSPETGAESRRLALCFSVGDATQAEALTGLSGRKVRNRELVVTRIGERSDPCEVLYVDSRQRWDAASENRNLGSTLTIGSYRGFVDHGGMIEIDLQSEGSRFDVNLAQARLAHVRLSPQLLRLARRVHE